MNGTKEYVNGFTCQEKQAAKNKKQTPKKRIVLSDLFWGSACKNFEGCEKFFKSSS